METDKTKEIGKQAAALALIEIGLGSFLHTFRIPLSGHLLSINQIALISRATFKLDSKMASLQISFISAILKSLSPSGKKLTPMLAIAAQGLFYYLGMSFFGINYLGLFVAVFMASLWAFVQPVLFIYILFGKKFVDVIGYFLREFEKIIPQIDHFFIGIITGIIILKFISAFFLSLMAIRLSDSEFDRFRQKMLIKTITKVPVKRPIVYLALGDLFNPLFIFSFIVTSLFFLFSHSNQSLIQTVWGLMRPLALGFIIFYTFRVFPVENLSAFLHRKGFTQLAKILNIAIEETRR